MFLRIDNSHSESMQISQERRWPNHPPGVEGGRRDHYLRLSLWNQLVKLSLHKWPLCGTGTAGQERSFLQQVLRPLCHRRGAHPSLHDNAELTQPASQQGLQRNQRALGCVSQVGRHMEDQGPELQITEDGWAFHRLIRWEKVELRHTGETRSFPTKVRSFSDPQALFLIFSFALKAAWGNSLSVADEQTEAQRPCPKP